MAGRWEYTTTVITHGFMGRQSDELNRDEFEKSMNDLGQQGWEAVSTLVPSYGQGQTIDMAVILKRRPA